MKNKKAFSLIELSVVLLIIGVIIAGITQSSRMLASFRLTSARTMTQSSPVVSIKDLSFWLDSTSEKSFEEADQDDGDQVDNWYDLNPQVNASSRINFTQGTSGYQPLYKTAVINNLPALKFDGSDDLFTLASTQTMQDFSASDQMTVFMVYKMLTLKDTNPFSLFQTSNSAIRIIPTLPGVGNSVTYFDYGTCCTAGQGRYTGSFNSSYVNRTNIFTWRQKSAVTTARMNGVQFLSTGMTSTFSASDLAGAVTFNLATGGSPGYYYLNGYIAEVIMFRRGLNSDEITDVEKYLGKKWGVRL